MASGPITSWEIDGETVTDFKAMAPHSSVLAWRIPGMAEPGGLPSMGSHRVGHDWRDLVVVVVVKSLQMVTAAMKLKDT